MKGAILVNYLYFSSLLLTVSFLSCKNSTESDVDEDVSVQSVEEITKKDITIENGALLKNVEYILMVGKVEYTVEIGLKKDSTIALKYNFYQPFTFSENLGYQEKVMDEIVKDFNPYSFRSVHLGRLIYTGDLCLAASKEVVQSGWDGADYPALKNILDTGAIVKTYASFFEKYGVKVSGVSFEKAFLTQRSIIHQYAKIETPEEDFPESILDAITWVILN